MKKRILTAALAVVCALTLFCTGITPAMASTPPSEGGAVTYAEEVRWYFRTRDGVEEMRLWSLTYQYWLTDWIPVPDDWLRP